MISCLLVYACLFTTPLYCYTTALCDVSIELKELLTYLLTSDTLPNTAVLSNI